MYIPYITFITLLQFFQLGFVHDSIEVKKSSIEAFATNFEFKCAITAAGGAGVGTGGPAPERRSFRAPLLPNLHHPCLFRTPGIAPRSDIATAMRQNCRAGNVQSWPVCTSRCNIRRSRGCCTTTGCTTLGDHQQDDSKGTYSHVGCAVHVGVGMAVTWHRHHAVGCSRSGECWMRRHDQNFGAPVKELPPL